MPGFQRDFYGNTKRDSRLYNMIANENNGYFKRKEKYGSAIGEIMTKSDASQELTQLIKYHFDSFYYNDGKGIGLANGGPVEDLFISHLVIGAFLQPFIMFSYAVHKIARSPWNPDKIFLGIE